MNINININIIGGAGFIGTRLIACLQNQGFNCLSIIDKQSSVTYPSLTKIADVRSIESLRATISPESVLINLAAEHRDDVRPASLYDEVNIDGANNICVVAREKKINTIVFTSTVAVYGFTPIGTDENGEIKPFNDYGRTKYEAEKVFRTWQAESPGDRSLIIIRPTVVFGEQNRGNVYNLLRQIAVGRFIMVGGGRNRKSMAYVGNLVSFIAFSMNMNPGVHTYNYVDKPDFTMSNLISEANRILGRSSRIRIKMPYIVAFFIGKMFDGLSVVTGKKYTISSIRVKKFCSNSVYQSSVDKTGFTAPYSLNQALEATIRYEFIDHQGDMLVFYTE